MSGKLGRALDVAGRVGIMLYRILERAAYKVAAGREEQRERALAAHERAKERAAARKKREERNAMSDNLYGSSRPKRWEKGETKIPPNTAGEYTIRNDETGEVLYVGESKDLLRPPQQAHPEAEEQVMRTHRDKSHKFDRAKHVVSYKEAKPGASSESRREHEKKKIAEHDPPWNKNRGGGGRK